MLLLTAPRLFRNRKLLTAAAITALMATGVGGFATQSSHAAGPMVSGYEQATIADTNFAVPPGAIFVDNNGSDSNAGTQTAPLATLGKALNVAPSGGTIVMQSGTYREGRLVAKRPVNIQAFPHAQVWVKGSTILAGFVANGNAWTRSWTSPLCQNCFVSTIIDPTAPAAGQPEQVFFDGIPQLQVLMASQVVPGTFAYDAANNQLVLGSDPAGKTVEVTEFDQALRVGGQAGPSTVRGIGFMHYGATYNDPVSAMVTGIGNATFDHDTFAWSASRGLALFGVNDVLSDSLLLYNGDNGFKTFLSHGLLVLRNRIAFSNFERFSILPSPTQTEAGAKIARSWNTVFSGNTFEDNYSNGLWFDVASTNTVIANNRFLRNAGHGISYEISGLVTIVNNVVADNGRDGIKLAGVSGAEVWNNTVVGNTKAAIGIYEDPRYDSNAADNAAGITFDTSNVHMFNNIFVGAATSTKPITMSFDISTPRVLTAPLMIAGDDYNVWGRPNPTAGQAMFFWAISPTSIGRYSNLAAAQIGMQREMHSLSVDNIATNAMFVNPAGYDFSAAAGSPIMRSGAPIPANILALMGNPSGPVMLGAH